MPLAYCYHMSCRVRAIGKGSRFFASSPYSSVGHYTKQHFRIRTTIQAHRSASNIRARHSRSFHLLTTEKQSGSGITAALLVFGFVTGWTLYALVNDQPRKNTKERRAASTFDYADRTDSFLVMAPNMPAGRPGTLTPEQEVKLRELWAATMKVFGAVEDEVNGTETASLATPSETTEKDGKKEKKKSRLHVFRRNKGEKGDGSESASSASTPASSTPDINKLSLSAEDDKHGQNKEFRDAIANMAPEDLRAAFWSMVKLDHPDALLLRFLRARKWDVEKALVMMVSTMHWRLEQMHVDDDIMKNGEEAALRETKSDDAKVKKEAEDFLTQLRMGKSYLHGLDAEGRPMCVVRARLHRAGEQSEASLERYTVYTIETARLLLRPPIDTAVSSGRWRRSKGTVTNLGDLDHRL